MTRSLLCVALLLLAGSTAQAQNPKGVEPLDGEAIAAIWKARQDKIKTARFEVSCTIFISAGYFTKVASPEFWATGEEIRQRKVKSMDKLVPPKDHKATTQQRFVIDGTNIRYDYSAWQIRHSSPDKELFQINFETAFDGDYFRRLSQEAGKTEVGQGVLQKSPVYPDANLVALSPLLTTFRGRSHKLCFVDPQNLTPTTRVAVIHGFECLEYRLGKENVTHFWLSPQQDWVVARITQNSKDRTITQNRQYQLDTQFGWIPKQWDYIENDRGVHTTSQFDVTSYVMNSPTERSEFVLKFAPGTEVFHEDAPGGVVGKVQENGTIVPDDGRPAYYLPGTEKPVVRYWRYVLLAVSVLLLTLLVVRAIRRYRRRNPSSSLVAN